MGGQNHQPTRPDITPASAWLSRQIGEGIIAVQQANNHLEDAIMIAMGRLHIEDLVPFLTGSPQDHLRMSENALRTSLAALRNIDVGFERLATVARHIGYNGNPLARSVRTFRLDEAFGGRLILPEINVSVWEELLGHIEEKNILATLDWERSQFHAAAVPTAELMAITEECGQIARVEGDDFFAAAVENNRVPFRQHYARVFSLWNHLNAMFLYSALIMTELYYRANGYSSLTEFAPPSRNSQVA
jgi:hypothetical protein